MKILRIIPSMNPKQGGPCQGIRNSIPEMQKRGIENEVVCLDAAGSDYLGKDSFIIHALGAASGPWAYNKNLVPWLQDNFSKYDVVIVHGLWLYHSYAAYKAWNKFKKQNTVYPKLYIMPHGMLDPYFQKDPERRLKAVRNWLYWKLIEKNPVNGADGVLFTCEEELRLAREPFSPYHPKKELNVSYGVTAPPQFSPQMKQAVNDKLNGWNGKPFILFLSRIHEKKGVDLLLKAYTTLEREIEKSLPQLVVAGPGLDTEYGKELVSIANGSANILFPGMLQGEAKWGAFYESEVFVLPSHQENFGIAVAEALSCGTPVIITDRVNIWREIEAGGGGLVCTNTYEGVYNALKKWLSTEDDNKAAMAVDAKNTYEQNYATENTVKRFVEALKE